MPGQLTPAEQAVADAQMAALFADDEERALFRAAQEAVDAFRKKRGCEALAALWALYAAPLELTKANFADYYGTKEVWTVVLELPPRVRAAAEKAAAAHGLRMVEG